MCVTRTSFLAGWLLCAALPTAAQQWRPRVAEDLPPLFAPVFHTISPAPLPQPFARHQEFRPPAYRGSAPKSAGRDFDFDSSRSFFEGSSLYENDDFRIMELPGAVSLQVTAEQTTFLTEARIPLAEMWSGRLRLSGVQQRFHSANLFSAVNPYWARDIALAPGTESIVGRSRVNYGVGLQFRFNP
ncbi:MAG: hypothetical protein ACRD5G_05915 [Candidatus Acidiferrales bacterium]